MLRALKDSLTLELRSSTHIRRRSLVFTCVFSGLAFRALSNAFFSRANLDSSLTVCSSTASSHCAIFPLSNLPRAVSAPTLTQEGFYRPGVAVFFADDSNHPESRWAEAKRLESLLGLERWIEHELPTTFSRSLFDSTGDMFNPNTVLEIERLHAPSVQVRGRSNVNLFFAGVRCYLAAVSDSRRIDLLNLHVDPKEWHIEVHFRVILMPSATREELRTLTPEHLAHNLEHKARWHDFRAIFTISKSGSLEHVKITQLTPPSKPPLSRTLERIRLIGNLVPGISGTSRRLPHPLPCVPFEKSAAYSTFLPMTSVDQLSKAAPFMKRSDQASYFSICPITTSSWLNSVLYVTQQENQSIEMVTTTPNLKKQLPGRGVFLNSTCPFLVTMLTSCSQSVA